MIKPTRIPKIALLLAMLLFSLSLCAQHPHIPYCTLSGSVFRCLPQEMRIISCSPLNITPVNLPQERFSILIDSSQFEVRLPQGTYQIEYGFGLRGNITTPIELTHDIHIDTLAIFDTTETYLASSYIQKYKYQDLLQRNPYARQYHDFVIGIEQHFSNFDIYSINQDSVLLGSMMWMLDFLPQVQIRQGYQLGGLVLGNCLGSSIHPYAYSQQSNKKLHYGSDTIRHFADTVIVSRRVNYPSEMQHLPTFFSNEGHLSQYLNVPFTEEGIWQYFLLFSSHNYTPNYWHARYNTQHIVFDSTCLEEIFPIHGLCSCQDESYKQKRDSLMLAAPMIRNQVEITSPTTATLHYTEWTDWGGLICEEIAITLVDGRIDLKHISSKVLYDYDCGIQF